METERNGNFKHNKQTNDHVSYRGHAFQTLTNQMSADGHLQDALVDIPTDAFDRYTGVTDYLQCQVLLVGYH